MKSKAYPLYERYTPLIPPQQPFSDQDASALEWLTTEIRFAIRRDRLDAELDAIETALNNEVKRVLRLTIKARDHT